MVDDDMKDQDEMGMTMRMSMHVMLGATHGCMIDYIITVMV